MSRYSLLLLGLLLAACGAAPVAGSSNDAGMGAADAASSEDAGSGVDASSGPDAGAPDASMETDAGPVEHDAGMGLDAGAMMDAGTAQDAGMEPDAGTNSGPALKTVFLILLENKNWDDFKGNSKAPYINGTLLMQGAHAESYSNPPGIHPSEPNYLWLEAGTNFGIKADGAPNTDHQSTTEHLVTQLEKAGISWKSYQEDIDGTTCPLDGVNNYAPKHNPMVFFDDVTDSLDPMSQHCIDHVRPYSELATDLKNNTVARYNFITPNLCDDGHNDCTPGGNLLTADNDEVQQTDTWLANNLPAIFNSSAYRHGGVVFVTWDESEPSLSCLSLNPQCPIGMMVFSLDLKADGYSNSIMYDHSSMLRTMQEIFNVGPFLGGAADATDLSDFFKTFP